MDFKFYIPTGILKEVADVIVFQSGDGTGVALQRMQQTIIINVGSHFMVSDIYVSGGKKKAFSETVWINGKQDIPFMLENDGFMQMYVVVVKPGMLPYLADIPAIETNNLAVGAEHWSSRGIFDLREQLLQCTDIHSGFLLIDNYLTDLLLRSDLSSIGKIKWLNKAIQKDTVETICQSLGITRKRLRSETQHHYGGSVKNLQGILRFNQTLSDIAHHAERTLSSNHTYYDQSHFINDFRARSGITPLQYKKLCLAYPHIRYTPNVIPLHRETFLHFLSPGQP